MSTPETHRNVAIPKTVLAQLARRAPKEWLTTSTTEIVRRYLEEGIAAVGKKQKRRAVSA